MLQEELDLLNLLKELDLKGDITEEDLIILKELLEKEKKIK